MCPLGSLRVLWEFVGKLSYIESLLWVLYKEPSRHIVKEQSEFVQKVPTTYLLGMSQENWWALFENNWYVLAGFGLGKSVGTFWKCPLFTHWVWARQIVSEPTINSQCTHWVYCPSPPVPMIECEFGYPARDGVEIIYLVRCGGDQKIVLRMDRSAWFSKRHSVEDAISRGEKQMREQ